MASYGLNSVQSVPLNQGAIFDTISGCPRGLVLHENQTATVILRGVPFRPCQRVVKYKVTAISNIALTEGATIVPIGVALVSNGEVRPASLAISTPTAVLAYDNVTVSDIINVPVGCCFMVSIDNVVASDADGYTPAPTILMKNLNININRIDN